VNRIQASYKDSFDEKTLYWQRAKVHCKRFYWVQS